MGSKHTISPSIPFPTGITADDFAGGDNEIPSAITGKSINFDITFSYTDDAGSPLPIEKLQVGSGVSGVSVSKKGTDTVNVSGKPALFQDEIWQFVFPNGSVVGLKPNNTQKYDHIIRWEAPGSNRYLHTYNFQYTVTDPLDLTETKIKVNLTQYFYWEYFESLSLFEDLAEKGKNY
ncbi:MAG: hypothetical protein EBT86_09595 [Actinobacteria bacterium]|nr:hypothetical protein [Actinomycetota bacterium]